MTSRSSRKRHIAALLSGWVIVLWTGAAHADALRERAVVAQLEVDAATRRVEDLEKDKARLDGEIGKLAEKKAELKNPKGTLEESEKALKGNLPEKGKELPSYICNGCESPGSAALEGADEADEAGEADEVGEADEAAPETASEGAGEPVAPTPDVADAAFDEEGFKEKLLKLVSDHGETISAWNEKEPLFAKDELDKNQAALAYCWSVVDKPAESEAGSFKSSCQKKLAALRAKIDGVLTGEGVPARLSEVEGQLKAKNEEVAKKAEELKEEKQELAQRQKKLSEAQRLLAIALAPETSFNLQDRMRGVRAVRCLTAFCFGGDDGTKFAIEPVLEIPISTYWAVGEGGLARHINATGVELSLNAGVRFWMAYDQLSIGVLLADPELVQTGEIQVDGSDKVFPSSAVSRPWPTVMVGILADVISFSVSYDQLRNTDGTRPVDERFRDKEVLSRAITMGVSINTFTALRNAFGAAKGEKLAETKDTKE